MSLHRGPGLAALSRHSTSSQAYSALSSQLTTQQLSDLRSQLDTFSSALRSFAKTHRNEILKNPEFRGEFQRMCANIGVDPLGGAGPSRVSGNSGKIAGIWNDLLGLGDFNYELGVQIVDVCISTREINGGVIEMDELIRRIKKLRAGRSRGQSSVKEEGTPISEEDVVRSIKTLSPLGSGYQVVALSTAPNAPKIVRSLPGELSLDSTLLLSLLACPNCPRDALGSGYAYLTEDYVMLPRDAEEPRKPRWSRQRARNALECMARDEGTLWVDSHEGQMAYYSVAVGAQSP